MSSPPRKPNGLSVHRSFVIELDAAADPARGRIGGRIEHVVSGRSASFGGSGELLAFLAEILDESAGKGGKR